MDIEFVYIQNFFPLYQNFHYFQLEMQLFVSSSCIEGWYVIIIFTTV